LPPWADDRLALAGEAELESWTDRVLEANSLEEVMLTYTAPPVGPAN
jgi:hypothetical protein